MAQAGNGFSNKRPHNVLGNILSQTGTMATTLGKYNPFRYRGYVYDQETGLYYLQSRYYNPELCRFISADSYTSTGQGILGHNMFAYCGNNPVVRKDDGGECWHLIVGAIIGVATQYISDVVSNLSEGKSFAESLKPSSTWADYGSAALSGALAASGVGLGVSIATNAALGGATYLANCAIKGEKANFVDLTLSIGVGAVSGRIGGSGANGAKLRGITSTSKQVLKTAVSPRKIAMYTAKIANVKKTVVISTARTMAAGFSANYLNNVRRGLTISLV